ncbi:MAG: ATP-dependent DNA helicase RecG [Janthinobacterium lividum]
MPKDALNPLPEAPALASAEAPAAARRASRAKPAKSPATGVTAKLASLGLERSIDLVLHLPIRYDDETRLNPIGNLLPGMNAQVEGVIFDAEVAYKPRRQLIVRLRDEAGDDISLRFLNFYGSQLKQLAEGVRLRARGDVRGGFFGLEMVHPAYRIVDVSTPLPETLTPVYSTTAGLSQTVLRRSIDAALRATVLPECLPAPVLADMAAVVPGLPSLAEAVATLHHPTLADDPQALDQRSHPAWVRVKFDEMLAQQLSLARARAARHRQVAPRMALPPDSAASPRLIERLHAALPFELTAAQRRVWAEISEDLTAGSPMQRLLQGDVGSGKTVIAALAAAQAIDAGYQVALMAPTELLAEQHARKLHGWLQPLGVTVAWLAGGLGAREKRAALLAVAAGAAQLTVGTHAIIQQKVRFARLGLAIVDEQHRFGVSQRLALRHKAGADAGDASDEAVNEPAADAWMPHQLMMSATPIPRTLAMTYYADLDVSAIDELPPGRTPIVTRLLSDTRRAEVIARVRHAALNGEQVYWVCPLIEESEALQLQTAVDTCAALTAALPELRIGLLHGRLSAAEKQAAMNEFAAGQMHLLVATTVIEVGIDVPNASLMVIEHGERFGLAQLHQLRGRIGRGRRASTCVVMYGTPLSATARERLKAIRETTDGFEIARRDLEIRGPGEFLGARQSGAAMLRFADLELDAWLIEPAQRAAQRLIAEFPDAALAHLDRWLGSRERYLSA